MTDFFRDFSSELGKVSSHKLSKESSDGWIALHSGVEKIVAKLVIENIIHVSMETFMKKINNILSELSLLSLEKKLLLYIPSTKKDTSVYFVSSLIYCEGKKEKLYFEKISNNLTDFLEYDSKNYLIVVCDDGSYTGKQLCIQLSDLLRFKNIYCYIAVGFVSETARKKLLCEIPRIIFANCTYFFNSLKEDVKRSNYFKLLSTEQRKIILKYLPTKHALYFDFKLPDEVSVIYDILARGKLIGKGITNISLIENGIPLPLYKKLK